MIRTISKFRISRLKGIIHKDTRTNGQKEAQKRFVSWAKSFYSDYKEWEIRLAEKWVNETFTFNPDGTAVVHEKLHLFGYNITRLPEGIVEVKGDVNLGNTPFNDLKTLPKKIGGDLNLKCTPLSSLEGLPDGIEIGKDLHLYNMQNLTSLAGLSRIKRIGKDLIATAIPAQSIPANVPVGGTVVIRKAQVELLADAKRKNYRVSDWA